ncbi:hypothetical protein MKZ38_010602 [Zalerion maritima]|uniref:Uncharacterized protein n=1 Tax=Zalerion maritima TaxID=339359 RepID=A0AAD5RS34_9PEZI|nr:hypothetical protein MKZ38_010602 [Zalerion maritima]
MAPPLHRRFIAAIKRRASQDSKASTGSTTSTSSRTSNVSTAVSTELDDGNSSNSSGANRRRTLVEQRIRNQPVDEFMLCDFLDNKFGTGNWELSLETDTYYIKVPTKLQIGEIRSLAPQHTF